MFTLPDKGEGDNDLQSVFFQEYLEVLVAGINGLDCVLSGCAVTGSAGMTPSVAKGAVLSNGTLFPVTAGTVTIGAAHATLPRLDLIVVDNTGAKQVRAGTAAASPKPPVRTANDVVLAVVYVPATDTVIATSQCIDLRVMRTVGPLTLKKQTTEVATNTTLAIFTLSTLTLPNGLFLAGKVLRHRIWGTYFSNSGAPTWTFTISYGGTTLYAHTTGVCAADADRGAWSIEFDLIAQGNADQSLNGTINFSTPGAKTVPTSGVAGNLQVTTDENVPIKGTDSAVDSDAADRILLVQATMSVSNAAVETTVSGATWELL